MARIEKNKNLTLKVIIRDENEVREETAKEILQNLFYFIDGNSFWLTDPKEEYIKQEDALDFMRKQASKYNVEVEE